ncbi:sigma-70 family RNA polymerase sigma factor [Streptomyces sp. NPDC096132]|uniref:sigma-70 family RNA polymerase sigma factor n=1 Tax=Streptomyces sp. NPDC096132 TaxID=3366075 RepID=UPI00381C223F
MDTQVAEARQSRETPGTKAVPTIVGVDNATWVFVRARPGLLYLAHRILGNAPEAEDVVQEAWLRWQGTDRTVVSNPQSLLRTTTVRLAINVIQSAWKRRVAYAGPQLPERADSAPTPEATAVGQDDVERAVLLLMERLTPNQRAAYVLREGFGYPYDRIAELLQLSVVNARQQVARAQERLSADRRRRPVDSVAHRRLVAAFLAAARSGDLGRLERVLSADARHRR